tara:strand:- start:650 stop:916 length:267 start_codon:yes stop_codon:yes gene_type:complete
MAITKADLESLVRRLNTAKKYKPTRKSGRYKNGKFKSDKGFHLDGAYGGYKLVFSEKDSSGERNITSGYSTKKELYEKIRNILVGMNL